MTSEQNVPEVESHQGSTMSPVQQDGEAQFAGQNVPHGMGQSKSSRRRRRKRKNKGSDAAPQAAPSRRPERRSAHRVHSGLGRSADLSAAGRSGFQANTGQQQNGSPAASAGRRSSATVTASAPRRIPGNVASGSNGGGFSSNGGGYRDRDTHQPGNNSGGFKRKGGGGKQQQRGPRSFVGPMDHSYRAVNGNFADTPPSTMDSHPTATTRVAATATAADAATRATLSQSITRRAARFLFPRRRADEDLLLY